MKFLNILALSVLAIGVVACSDDDKPSYNDKGGVTVCMEEAQMSFLETKGIVKVPFEVKGERNGYVTVTCEVREYGSEPAMENVHYLVTDYTVNVDTMDTTGYIEIKLVDDADENPARAFEVSLVSAEGATISGLETTLVTIKDNDGDPYLRLAGQWKVSSRDLYGNPQADRIVTLEAFDEGERGYYSYYYMHDLLSIVSGAPCKIKVEFNFDAAAHEGDLTFAYGQDIGEYDNAGEMITGRLGFALYEDGGLYIGALAGDVVFTWTENARELKLVTWPGVNDVDYEGATFSCFGLVGGQIYYVLDNCVDVTTFTKVLN